LTAATQRYERAWGWTDNLVIDPGAGYNQIGARRHAKARFGLRRMKSEEVNANRYHQEVDRGPRIRIHQTRGRRTRRVRALSRLSARITGAGRHAGRLRRPESRRPTMCGSSSLIGENSVFARSGCALAALGLTPLAGPSFRYRAEGLRSRSELKRSITVPQPAAPSVPLKRLVHGDCIHHPVHRRMRAVLDLDPMLGPAGLIRSILVLRAKTQPLAAIIFPSA
jgi:hypothetical protein